MGAAPNVNLRFVAAGGASLEQDSDVTLRDEVAYQLTERGIDIATTLHCDQLAASFRELVVPLRAGVQFISAHAEDSELTCAHCRPRANWRIDRCHRPAAIVQRAKPANHDALRWHPLVTAAPIWLPKLRPKGLFWTGGSIELFVAPGLELQRLVPLDCLQTDVASSAVAGSGAETHWFTAFSPAAGLEVTLALREPGISARLGSSLALGEPAVTGRLDDTAPSRAWQLAFSIGRVSTRLEFGIRAHVAGRCNQRMVCQKAGRHERT